jgi:hypothetical protein
MADVTDPPPADGGRIDGADGWDTAREPQQARAGLVLAAPGPPVLRVLDLTGMTTGVPLYSSVEEAAGVASRQRAARPVRRPDPSAAPAGLPTVRPERQQEEGRRDPHQQPVAADTGPHSP